jgi:DNA modification methylase
MRRNVETTPGIAALTISRVEDLNLEPMSFDAILCDPPYGLEFMAKDWDRAIPPAPVWNHLLQALKPGGYAMVFGGTRTWHRLAVAIEDGGFDLRDTLMWLYGSGFPKGHDISKGIDRVAGEQGEPIGVKRSGIGRVSRGGAELVGGTALEDRKSVIIADPATPEAKQWAGYNTTLKPAWEPILLAMRPLSGTYVSNALTHGTGGLNITGGRIGTEGGCKAELRDTRGPTKNAYGSGLNDLSSPPQEGLGRWPSNLILDPYAADIVDGLHGKSKYFAVIADPPELLNDSLRCYYTSKASPQERGPSNSHPTVKPLSLCRYLATLLLPPARPTPRRILIPFSGSGSEVIGALRAGWDYALGIDRNTDYILNAYDRIEGSGHEVNFL